MKRGDIYFCNLEKGIGNEQGRDRPVLIIQNDDGNKRSLTTIVACITTKSKNQWLPTHVSVLPRESGLKRKSVIMLEQIKTVSFLRFSNYIGTLDNKKMKQVEKAIKVSLGIIKLPKKKSKRI